MLQVSKTVNGDSSARLNLLQSGFRNFVGGVKLPISSDTRWLLEAVCLDKIPTSVTAQAPILEQTQYFLEGFLWQHQSQINTNRQEWLARMKANSN